jgi:hypothetical protein
MLRFLPLLVCSSAAFAHPGHGALEVHWHFDDLVWLAIAFALVVFLIRKALKK